MRCQRILLNHKYPPEKNDSSSSDSTSELSECAADDEESELDAKNSNKRKFYVKTRKDKRKQPISTAENSADALANNAVIENEANEELVMQENLEQEIIGNQSEENDNECSDTTNLLLSSADSYFTSEELESEFPIDYSMQSLPLEDKLADGASSSSNTTGNILMDSKDDNTEVCNNGTCNEKNLNKNIEESPTNAVNNNDLERNAVRVLSSWMKEQVFGNTKEKVKAKSSNCHSHLKTGCEKISSNRLKENESTSSKKCTTSFVETHNNLELPANYLAEKFEEVKNDTSQEARVLNGACFYSENNDLDIRSHTNISELDVGETITIYAASSDTSEDYEEVFPSDSKSHVSADESELQLNRKRKKPKEKTSSVDTEPETTKIQCEIKKCKIEKSESDSESTTSANE